MKTKTISLILFFILLSSFSLSQAQGMRHGPGMRGGMGDDRSLRASDLNLSPDQMTGLSRIQQAYVRETQLLRAELLLRTLELREFLTNPSAKAESIRAKYLETIELQSKLEEKSIEYLIKVRNLLTQEQLRYWAPEQEFSFSRRMMHRPGHMGPMHHNRIPPPRE